ncbi:MAG: dihydropteroate synthase [Phycisphaerales bacterium]|nr:dihydropteroate synthase [Phycisphaerales bacterium]
MTRIIGILNLTRDSFSDGGRFLEPSAAVEHAQRMIAAGASVIDVGPESTHPDAESVPDEEQIARLTPVMAALRGVGAELSVDAQRPRVMEAALALGATIINDVSGLRDADAVRLIARSEARVILMHARHRSGAGARAERLDAPVGDIVEEVLGFFRRRIAELGEAGVAAQRLILDPGMGFFLSTRAADSVRMLAAIGRLRALGLPVCVSVSRKSFIGEVLAEGGVARPVAGRGAGTLLCEIWAAQQGVEFVRTHDVGALADALKLLGAIGEAGGAGPG